MSRQVEPVVGIRQAAEGRGAVHDDLIWERRLDECGERRRLQYQRRVSTPPSCTHTLGHQITVHRRREYARQSGLGSATIACRPCRQTSSKLNYVTTSSS